MKLKTECDCGCSINFKKSDIKTIYEYLLEEYQDYGDKMELLSTHIEENKNGFFKKNDYNVIIDVSFNQLLHRRIKKIKYNYIECPFCKKKVKEMVGCEEHKNEKIIDNIKYPNYKIIENSEYINSVRVSKKIYNFNDKININYIHNPFHLNFFSDYIIKKINITENEFNKLKKEFELNNKIMDGPIC